MEASEIILPPGVHDPRDITDTPDRVVIDNRTGMPDHVIEDAVQDYFVEHASLAGVQNTTFQTYANEGGLLARRQFRTPANVIDEIKLARDLAERDDDVAAVMGEMLAVAFGEGMQNQHADEKTVALFNKLAENMGLDLAFQEMYRELLISSQINTALLFTRENINYSLSGSDRILTESLAAPLLGVLPAENIRVVGNDLFRTAVLAFEPDSEALRRWLDEYFDPRTTAARKAKMGREDRVSANLFTGVIEIDALDYDCPPAYGGKLYTLNPRLVKRTTYPKGSWKYPRPLLTRDFALLEAKRLLNIMDYALLQGGSNFVVVAKKGSDERPAQRAELENLERVVRTASRTGVIVGDHRLSFEIITPKLDELLNPEKRKMLGRKLAMAMLRSSEMAVEDGGSAGVQYETEIRSRVIGADRRLIARHVEAHCYEETVNRNSEQFGNGRPSIWFAKIVLQGTQYFTDYIIKLRDRGDIPRRWATEAAGFDFDAAVAERQREVDNDVDDVMAPAAVPFASPELGPQDNNTGRPPGAKDGSTPDPARPKKTISRNSGETVRAWYDEDEKAVVRCGEITYAILDQHLETKSMGRLTSAEREVAEKEEIVRRGPLCIVPVNEGVEVSDLKAVRLREGLSMVVGSRRDGTLLAKAISFREPEFDVRDAENAIARWGFPVKLIEDDPEGE